MQFMLGVLTGGDNLAIFLILMPSFITAGFQTLLFKSIESLKPSLSNEDCPWPCLQ